MGDINRALSTLDEYRRKQDSGTVRAEDITHDMFYAMLCEIVRNMGPSELLAVPGVYEALSEDLNNEVLEALGVEDD